MRRARSQPFSSTRCRIDRITEGSALEYSMTSIELDDVAGLDAAGLTVEKILVDDAAQFRRRQRVVAAHQVLDLEAAVLTDGLQRCEDVGDFAVIGEWHEQPLIGDDAA